MEKGTEWQPIVEEAGKSFELFQTNMQQESERNPQWTDFRITGDELTRVMSVSYKDGEKPVVEIHASYRAFNTNGSLSLKVGEKWLFEKADKSLSDVSLLISPILEKSNLVPTPTRFSENGRRSSRTIEWTIWPKNHPKFVNR